MKKFYKFILLFFQLYYSVFSQAPMLINYQGYINQNGSPLNGTVSIEFSLLDKAVGGTFLWSETQNVFINEGNFSVLLGSSNMLNKNLFSENELFLEMKIGSEVLTPRIQFTSVAYSILAKSVEQGSINSDNIIDGAVTQSKLGEDIKTIPRGPAGGDLSGDYPNPVISKLKGNPISETLPDSGQVLIFDGTKWNPSNPSSSSGIKSIDGVENEGGNVDLIAGSNISINSDDNNNSITISSSGGTGGGDITSVIAGNGLTGGGQTADVTLNIGAGDGITVLNDNIQLNTIFTDGLYVGENQTSSISSNMITDGQIQNVDLATNSVNSSNIQDNSLTTNDIQPSIVSSIDGVTNDGGNIDLIAGANISITPNDLNNSITIEASGGAAGDNLGNHSATQNINLNGHYLSGDGDSEGVYIDDSGNMGISADTSDLKYKIELGKKTESSNYLRLASKDWGGVLFDDGSALPKTYCGGISYGYSTNSLYLDTKSLDGLPSTKMLIDGNGNVGIGTESPTRKFWVNGDTGGTTSWFNDSDKRLKTNIKNIDNALGKIKGLRGVFFDWKDKTKRSDHRQLGFIAQEVIDIIPEVVEKKGEYYSMQYAPMTALLLEAIKEQQKIIEKLNSRIEKLENSK